MSPCTGIMSADGLRQLAGGEGSEASTSIPTAGKTLKVRTAEAPRAANYGAGAPWRSRRPKLSWAFVFLMERSGRSWTLVQCWSARRGGASRVVIRASASR